MSARQIACIAFILILILSGCDRHLSICPFPEADRELSVEEKQLVATDNAFGIRLFTRMVESGTDSNLFISPLSVMMALSMTANGAAGSTRTAMENTLGSGMMSQDAINVSGRSLIDLLSVLDPDVVFEIANSIWIREGFDIETRFIDLNQTYYDADVKALDFNLLSAPATINNWISDKTHQKISHVLDYIPRDTMLYIINAIYFLGLWKTQFDADLTTDGVFQSPVGPVPCRMMHIESRFRYLETDDFQAVDLPYGNEKFSMTVLLPRADKTVDALAGDLNTENLALWTTQFIQEDVVLDLPKFTVEYEIELKEILTAMGMGVAFDPSEADFTGIHPLGGLYISRVLHKTFVEVDEAGTEAAAVTVVEIGRTSIGGSIMVVDRPFIFLIRENHSGTILFMGRIVNPQA